FHCCIFVDDLADFPMVQSHLCGDRATEYPLIDSAERPRHDGSQPTDPGRGMGVADDDAGAKDGETGKADVAHGVFLHAHDAGIAKSAAAELPAAESRQNWAMPASRQPRAKAPTTPSSSRRNASSLQRADPEPTPTQLTALTGPWLETSRARAAVRSAKSAAPVSRTTLRTLDRAAMGFLVTITTSRHSGMANSSATAAPPTCPVP